MTPPQTVANALDLQHLFDLDPQAPRAGVAEAFAALRDRHERSRWYYLGFPVAYDTTFPHTYELLAGRLINNISTTEHWPPGHQHAMEAEAAVLDWLARLFGFGDTPKWGHVTTGGTAGNRAGIRAGRRRYPDAFLLHSGAAHYSVATAGKDFALPTISVEATAGGVLDLDRLDAALARLTAAHHDPAVIVVATYGTTVTEASDDVEGIHALLDKHRITRRYLHLDAALAGIPMALDDAGRFDLADSVSVSGYKFLAVPAACGLVVGRGTAADRSEPVPYTQTLDETETGVRSGLHAALIYEAIAQHGNTGLRARAHASRELTDYTIRRLADIGVPAWRHAGAYFTLVLPTPPESVLARWTLANTGLGSSHIICVPGVRREQIDHFVTDLAEALPDAATARRGLSVPRQRGRH